jgi:hypothetical protein
MELFFRYVPIMFIVVMVANAFIIKGRAQKHIDQNPELKAGYDKIFKGFLLFGNIPWIIMLLGNLTGTTHSVFDYFNPRGLNPIVLMFHFSIVALYLAMFFWIFINDGADFLSRHPGVLVFRFFGEIKNVISPLSIKLFFALILLSGSGAMLTMWFEKISSFPVK